MNEHLLNIKEAASYLGVSEKNIKELADSGELPAYKIGGTFLRFRKDHLDAARTLTGKAPARKRGRDEGARDSLLDSALDFIYYNDFYIFSAAVIALAFFLLLAT